MLFHAVAATDPGVYVEQYTCLIRGALDEDALRQAWREVTDQHPALRTVFLWEQLDEPLQVVREQVPLDWTVRDMPGPSEAVGPDALEALLAEDRQRGFDLTQAPLFRLMLLRLDPATHRLIWTFHHVLLDGWSTVVILDEVWARYASRVRGEMPARTAPRPFREYVTWCRQQDLGAAKAYWVARLDGFTEPTSLGLPAPPAGSEGHARRQRDVPAAQAEALRTFARRHRLTLNTVVQGAWALLLHRYSGRDDLVYGTTVSGRPPRLRGVEAMVGAFINTLPVRVRIDLDTPLVPWLQGLQDDLLSASRFEYTPLAQIRPWAPVRGGRPLFDSLVVFESHPPRDETALAEAGLAVTEAVYLGQSNYPLALLVLPEEQLHLVAVYDAKRYAASAIDRLLGHLAALLVSMTAEAEGRQPLRDITLLSVPERTALLASAQASPRPEEAQGLVHQRIERQAAEQPGRIAVQFEHETVTYGALDERAGRLAASLQRRGVAPGALVGLLVERAPDMIVGLLGILKAGAGYVPLEPSYPDDRLRFMLDDTGAQVVVTTERLQAHPALADVDVCVTGEPAPGDGGTPEDGTPGGGTPGGPPGPDDPAYVIYTSGSTGTPKGVVVAHRHLAYSTQARLAYYPEPPAAFLLLSPFSFDSSVAGLFWTLATGGTLVLPRPGEEREVRQLGDLIQQHAVTHLLGVPSLYDLLLEHVPAAALASLKAVIVAGEACPPMLPERHRRRLPAAALYNEYGPTEATVWATAHRLHPNGARAARASAPAVPIGRPIPGAEAYVLDAHRRLVPMGLPGELYLGGPGVTEGYVNRPDLTAEQFIPHPFREAAPSATDSSPRLYRTGDRVRLREDGLLEFLGRVDEQVKLRGYRIELGEVDAALQREAQVLEAAAAVRTVDGRPQLVAYVVLTAAAAALDQGAENLTLTGLRQRLRERLPDHLIPAVIELVQALPRSPNGKVDRGALPAPTSRRGGTPTDLVAPGDPIELQMAEIWQDVLDVRPLSMEDNFFDVGGHSLLAITLFMRIENAFGTALPISSLFDYPTPRALAALLRAEAPPLVSPVPMRAQGARPPLFCVPGSGGYPILFYKLATYLDAEQPVYAFEPQGVDGRALPHTSIEAMAHQHVAELRRVQPEGPYRLCGFSVGGLVAYEMAQRLRDDGEEVAFLGLLDTERPRWSGPSAWWRRVKDTLRYWRGRHEALRHLRRDRVMPKALRNSFPAKVHERAARRYAPRPYPGPVHLFSATATPDFMQGNAAAWAQLVEDRFIVHEIEAGHSIVQEPYVGDLANLFTDILRTADAPPESPDGDSGERLAAAQNR